MEHIEGTFKGVRDTDIYYQAWLPDGEAKAVILVVHGLGEHSGRYTNVVDHFVPLGYAVYGHDLVGHGKSGGRREYVERFEDFTGPLATYYDMVKDWQPGKPIFLLGHSVGGLIAPCYLFDHPADFQGAIFSAPSVKAGESISAATIALAKILAAVVPKAGLEALDATAISRDPEVVRAYVEDPLVFHGKTPARAAAEMLRAIDRVQAEAHTLTLPFVVVQGSADRLVNPAGAQMLYDEAASADKTIHVYEGLYHEVFNEPERDRVLGDVEAWLEAHC
jgi:acylglycerol lipase